MASLPWRGSPAAPHRAGWEQLNLPRMPQRPQRSRRSVWGAASSGGGGGDDASFLDNPAIARRELLRRFYAASDSESQLELLQQGSLALDLGTRCGSLLGGTACSTILPLANCSLKMLCHTADLSQKGMLPGSLEQQALLVRTLHDALAPSLPTLQPLHLATSLWAYGVIGISSDWTDQLLQQVACREVAAQRLEQYNTKELTSLLYAYGRLMRLPSPEVRQYGALLAGELSRRWSALPYIRGGFSSKDFADLAEACAALCAGGSGGSGPASSGSREAPPAAVAALLDDVAVEVRRQLANKNSQRSPWTPRDLLRLARAYAALGRRGPRVAQLFDSLSSFCVQRIASRHLNCVSRPEDLAGLLEAYADLNHVSVVVPELLAAVCEQARAGAARHQDRLQAVVAGPAGSRQQQPASSSTAEEGFSLPLVNSLLRSHLRLGYRPPSLLLQCLEPQVWRQVPSGSAAEAADMLQLLAALEMHPNAALVQLLVGRVSDGGQPEALLAAQQAADVLLEREASGSE